MTSTPDSPRIPTDAVSREAELRRELAELEGQRKSQQAIGREQLVRATDQLVSTLTQPDFVENMRRARGLSDRGEGLDSAADLLSVDSLREAGVDLPADFRMSSRIFEDRARNLRLEIKELVPGDPSPVGIGGCAGGGGLTFCGCAGGST